MTKQQEKKALDALRWNKNVNIQFYICLILIIYLILESKKIEFFSFHTTFNIIVNSIMILSFLIALGIKFGWEIPYDKILLYSKYQLSLEEEEKKKKMEKARQKAANAESKYKKAKDELEENY